MIDLIILETNAGGFAVCTHRRCITLKQPQQASSWEFHLLARFTAQKTHSRLELPTGGRGFPWQGVLGMQWSGAIQESFLEFARCKMQNPSWPDDGIV